MSLPAISNNVGMIISPRKSWRFAGAQISGKFGYLNFWIDSFVPFGQSK